MKGNKGEWTEAYVFLKLLAEGKLFTADKNLQIIPDAFFPIIKIIKNEINKNRDYVVGKEITIVDPENDELITSVQISEFLEHSKKLYKYITQAKGRSFEFPDIEKFLREIEVDSLKSASKDKSDIRIKLHDTRTGLEPELGFSIKSMMGKNSTLFNPQTGTNFIFKISHPENHELNIEKFNSETLKKSDRNNSKISIRLKTLRDLGFNIDFDSVQSKNLEMNLTLIDSRLPEILSELLIYRYISGYNKVNEVIDVLRKRNPLGYKLESQHDYYGYKIKRFLSDCALGMTPETKWSGKYDATGGIIVARQDGALACYHVYNKNDFEEYLLTNTRLEQASTSEDPNNPGHAKKHSDKPFHFGWVYLENGIMYLKLNLQIRFI